MSEDRTWLMHLITTRTAVKTLDALIACMPPEYRGDNPDGSYVTPVRKAEKARFIRDARDAYWSDQQADRPQDVYPPNGHRRRKRPARRKSAADLCEIPAAECNAFLRNLPDWGKE